MSDDARGGGSLFIAFLAGAVAGGAVVWLATHRHERERAVEALQHGGEALARAARAAREALLQAGVPADPSATSDAGVET